eukprot:1944118-Prymnesium_polylepis.1
MRGCARGCDRDGDGCNESKREMGACDRCTGMWCRQRGKAWVESTASAMRGSVSAATASGALSYAEDMGCTCGSFSSV